MRFTSLSKKKDAQIGLIGPTGTGGDSPPYPERTLT